MQKQMTKEFIVVDGIVSCPNCGARNKISMYSTAMRPVCGQCKTPLGTAIDAYTPKHPSPHTSRSVSARPRKTPWAAYLTIALVAGAAAIFYAVFMNSPHPSSPPRTPLSQRYQSYLPPTMAQPTAPALNRRLPHGTMIRCAPLTGNGTLTVINGLDRDAAAKLVNKADNTCEAFFYISANSTYELPGIPDGDYRLLFGTGFDWDNSVGFFTRNAGCSEFNKPMDFETRTERRGWDTYLIYSTMEITLHAVPDGNARTHDVSATEFQRY